MVPQFKSALICTIKGDHYGFMCKKKDMSIESSTFQELLKLELALSYYENDKE